MFVFRRLLLYLNPIYFIASLEFIKVKQGFWWLALLLGIVLILFTVFEFTKRKLEKKFFNFLLAPMILFLSSFAFLLFIEDILIYNVATIASAVFLYLFLDQIFNYFYFNLKYQPYTLESFSFYINILAVYFLASSLFSSLIFLRFNRFLFALVLIVLTGLMV